MNEEKDQNRQKGLQTWLIVVSAILLLSIIGNIIYMTRSGRLSDEKEELVIEKAALQTENVVLSETVEVKDSIIEEHKEKLELLAEEHEAMVREKDARIAQLSRRATAAAQELEEQKEVNDELTGEMEALEHKIEELTNEIYLKKQEMDALAAAYELLQEQAREAEPLNVYNICVLTKWDRWLCADRYNVSRARRVDHTSIRFEVAGTTFSETGTKDIHLLLYNPDDELMYASPQVFTIAETGEESAYTQMRDIEYDHEPVALEFDIIHPERLQTGSYKVEVYVDGTLSRTKEMLLE